MPNPPTTADEKIVVGRIRGAFGIKGWVKVASYTEPVDNLLHYRPWYLEGSSGWRLLNVTAARLHQNGLVAQFVGVGDREAAEALKGKNIAVPAGVLPDAEEDEFYWRDLVGLAVVDAEGRALGAVRELMPTGGNDVLVVASVGGPDILIPFHRQYVLAVDLAQGLVRVDWDPAWNRDQD